MRKQVSICIIERVDDIPDADALSVAKLRGKGWKIVVKRGQFKPGDECVYFEIDSCLPVDDPRYEFLKGRCLKKFMGAETIRVKTIKLRGVVSQGLLIPRSEFPELAEFNVDDDVSNVLGVVNYDTFVASRLPKNICGEVLGTFPSFVPKTDEERIQNLDELFENECVKRLKFEVTEKYDGASATYFYAPSYRDEPFGVCSRNVQLRETAENVYWEMARRLNLREKLAAYYEETGIEVAIQGELVGPKINGNRDCYDDYDYFVFRVFDISENVWFTPDERLDLCLSFKLKHVKILNAEYQAFVELDSLDKMLAYAEGQTDRGHEREGVVFKEIANNALSFKVISNKYLLSGDNHNRR